MHRIFTSTLLVSFCLAAFTFSSVNSQQYNLVWSDEFEGNSLDRSKWNYEINCDGGGNNELQCYTNKADNLYVSGGMLHLRAKPENYQNKQYTSARVNTKDTASWKYGKFQTRAKLPKGDYLWPAIWMMPKDSVYGMWAASGEIDIMESRGQTPRVVEGTVHHGSGWPNNVYTGSGPRTFPFDFTEDFHVFEVIWTRDQIQWLVDGTPYHTQSLLRNFYGGKGANPYNDIRQPFDQRFFFILNLAIGGGFFGAQANALTQGVARAWAQPEMIVDYVRVYQEGGNPIAVQPVPVPVPKPTNNVPTPSAVNPSNPSTSGACAGKCGGASCCDDQRNGAVCYNALAYDCPVDSFNQKTLLCGKGLGACGGVCFDNNNYICQAGKIAQKPPGYVAPAPQPTTPKPANPAPAPAPTPTQNSGSGAVCPAGGCGSNSCCNDGRNGPVCYSPNTHTCAQDNRGIFQLCGKGNGSCNGACFDANIYQCVGGKITQKK
jgi:beta-glucanase (GH16 family)